MYVPVYHQALAALYLRTYVRCTSCPNLVCVYELTVSSPSPRPSVGKYPHLVARVASKAAKKAEHIAPSTSLGWRSEVTVNFHEVAVGATIEKYIEIANVSPVSTDNFFTSHLLTAIHTYVHTYMYVCMPAIVGVFSGYRVYCVIVCVLPSVLLILHIRMYVRM